MRFSLVVTLAIMTAALCFGRASDPQMVAVEVKLVDPITNQPLAGLVRIRDAAGRTIHPGELLSRGSGLESVGNETDSIHDWSVLPGPTRLRLASGRYTVDAISGLERESVRNSLDATAGNEKSVQIRLPQFSDLRGRLWRSGNTHLHLKRLARADADRYLEQIPRADDLDLLFVSHLERAGDDQTYISNTYRPSELAAIGKKTGVTIGNGEEHRHNFGAGGEGYGHAMFLNIKQLVQPVSIGPGIARDGTDGIPLRRGIDAARRQSAAVLWCHNDWGRERIANLVSGRLTAQNVFDGSIRSNYEQAFYRDLNAGFRVPLSTGTDWFIYDFSRVYVLVRGRPTVEDWLAALGEGRTFITNGPLLDLRVAGRDVGETVRLGQPGPVRIEARAAGRSNFDKIEIIQNGKLVLSAPAHLSGNHFEANIHVEMAVDQPCWFALRTPPPPTDRAAATAAATSKNELGRPLFAHTSATHVEIAGRRYFDRRAAAALLADIESSREMIAKTARFADAQERSRVLDVYADATSALNKRIAELDR